MMLLHTILCMCDPPKTLTLIPRPSEPNLNPLLGLGIRVYPTNPYPTKKPNPNPKGFVPYTLISQPSPRAKPLVKPYESCQYCINHLHYLLQYFILFDQVLSNPRARQFEAFTANLRLFLACGDLLVFCYLNLVLNRLL
jgi:hypothetical protein